MSIAKKNNYPLITKIKRHLYYEAGITSKVNIKSKDAMSIFLKSRGHENVGNTAKMLKLLLDLREAGDPVLNARAIRKPRKKTDYRNKYENYLQSDIWDAKRNELFDERGRICQRCMSVNQIEVHHITYNNLGNEPLEDLLVLCTPCHLAEHKRLNRLSENKKKLTNISGPLAEKIKKWSEAKYSL